MPPLPLLAAVFTLALAGSARAASAEAPGAGDSAGLDFFEKKIRPVLAEKCFKCHSAGADKIKGGSPSIPAKASAAAAIAGPPSSPQAGR